MGRFHTAAEFYRFREPYPLTFFAAVAQKLGLWKQTKMLDVACGPGNLAIGFAPFVENVLAIDLEPEMLRLAREGAGNLDIQFAQVPVEELEVRAESFQFVTVGRALHWLPRAPTLAILEHAVAPAGVVAICGASSSDAPCNAWTKHFQEVRRAWASDRDEAFYRPDPEAWFQASRFRPADVIEVQAHYKFTVEQLIARGLSFSVTSPAALGGRRLEFEAELRRVLEPFATGGLLEELVVARATIFAKV